MIFAIVFITISTIRDKNNCISMIIIFCQPVLSTAIFHIKSVTLSEPFRHSFKRKFMTAKIKT